VTDERFDELAAQTNTKEACALLGASRATRYRRRRPPVAGPPAPRPTPPNALSEAERRHGLALLRSPEHCDLAPAQVWARLLDDGVYVCSVSTMHRLLAVAGENRERRRQRTHPAKKRPELIARRPNEVWSWDITKLQGPERGLYYELFVVIDILSRYVVGWMVSPAETGELAEAFIADTLARHGVGRCASQPSALVVSFGRSLAGMNPAPRPNVAGEGHSRGGSPYGRALRSQPWKW